MVWWGESEELRFKVMVVTVRVEVRVAILCVPVSKKGFTWDLVVENLLVTVVVEVGGDHRAHL